MSLLPAVDADPLAYEALPQMNLELVWLVFTFLPVDQRLLLNTVCRAWRAAMREPSIWRKLNFYGTKRRVTLEMIHAALRYARGQLRILSASNVHEDSVPFEAVLELVRANAGSLEKLGVALSTKDSLDGRTKLLSIPQVDALLAAAPGLKLLQVGVFGASSLFLPLLTKEPPYGALELTHVSFDEEWRQNVDDAVDLQLQPLLEALTSHEYLHHITIAHAALTVHQLETIVEAALREKLTTLRLFDCRLSVEHLAVITRLLKDCSSLHSFVVENAGRPVFVGEGMPAFCAALRASKLESLSLASTGLWGRDEITDGLAVLEALTGHQSLTDLCMGPNQVGHSWIGDDGPDNKTIVSEALGRLVATDSKLEKLDLGYCFLADAGLRSLFEALAGNQKLRVLDCRDNYLSGDFARDVVLPAVRANASLRKLVFVDVYGDTQPELEIAGQEVAAREQI
jgi:hypothetical protein